MGETMSDDERPCGDLLRSPRYCRRRATMRISTPLLLSLFRRGVHGPYLITSDDRPIPDDASLVGWSHIANLDAGTIDVAELTIHSHELNEVDEGADPPLLNVCARWFDLNRVWAALLPRANVAHPTRGAYVPRPTPGADVSNHPRAGL